MSGRGTDFDWEYIFEGARAYAGLSEGDAVPVDEVREQALAEGNGYSESTVDAALRDTDEIVPAGDDLADGVILAGEAGIEDSGEDKSESFEPAAPDAAFAAAIDWFHGQLNTELPDGRTAREYLHEERGWSDDTIAEKRLGFAPASAGDLLDHLMRAGFDREEILATGLFWEDGFDPIWQGRLVFPYDDESGKPAFAISRSVDHPADTAGDYGDGPAKYHKIAVSREYVGVEEPIFGLSTVREGEPVLITEGIADAITAHQYGYPCVSPVTTRFKHDDRERLVEALEARDVPRVYIVQDAELPTSDLRDEADADGWGRLSIEQYGEGLRGAVDTAAHLIDAGVDAFVGALPRPGDRKIDLDDYLQEWATDGDLSAVLASAKPGREHPAFDPRDASLERAYAEKRTGTVETSSVRGSALYDLDVFDVSGLGADYRGKSPLGHHGDSENYFAFYEKGGEAFAYDHKYKATYTPLTYLLVEAGERSSNSPNGRLDDSEHFAAWSEAKSRSLLSGEDPIPYKALLHLVRDHGLADAGDIPSSREESLPADAYNAALDVVRDEYGVDPGRGAVGGSDDGANHWPVEECEPPTVETEPFDVEAQRAAFQDELYDAFTEASGPVLQTHNAGSGKSTNALIGGDEHERPHAGLFQNHKKGRESKVDDPTPEGYFHLKGAEQYRHDEHMDANHAGEPVPDDAPHMCPVYDLPKGDSVRQTFEALTAELGPRTAHIILGDELPDHGEDGECAWLEQFEAASNAERLVGVHEYQTLKTVQTFRDAPRDVIIDEAPDGGDSERRLNVEALVKSSNALQSIADLPGQDVGTADALRAFASFASGVVGVFTDPDAPDTLAELTPPSVDAESVHVEVDPDDLPDGVDPDDVEKRCEEEYAGMPEEGYRMSNVYRAGVPTIAEALAKAKFEYHDTLLRRVRDGEWNGTPFGFDALLAAAVEAGLDSDDVRKVIALPTTLESCPRCSGHLEPMEGRRVCTDEGCRWTEGQDSYTLPDGECARTAAYIDADPRDPEADAGLVFESLPLLSSLPDDPLILDATGDAELVAAEYGVTEDEVTVFGDETLEMPALHTTQVLDGQYHAGTIANSADDGGVAAGRIQKTIDTTAAAHEKPLYVVKKSLIPKFDFPANGTVIHYHALRGLNFNDHDAVVLIGAPHPDMADLQRRAQMLAQWRDDLDAGGEEYSTRRNAPNPPVYRKLRFEDDDGRGRAVPTKAYSGLVGKLFERAREKELIQALHRIRPLLAEPDEDGPTKHAYLLTNVPTDIPIDEVCSFSELADPLRALLPVPDRALEFAEVLTDTAQGETPEGFRAGALVESDGEGGVRFRIKEVARLAHVSGFDVHEVTVRRWIDALADIGLVDAGAYEQRRGVAYTGDLATLTSALSVVSNNGGVKVAVKRRFRRLTAEAGGSLGWLEWARDALGLSGDRVHLPPPGSTPG